MERLAPLVVIAVLVFSFTAPVALAADSAKVTPVSLARAECRELFLDKKAGDEVDCFMNHVRTARTFCQVASMFLEHGDSDKLSSCIREYEQSLKAFFDLARPRLARKKGASEALKELYSYALGGLRAMMPEPSELRIDYKRRQAERNQGIEDRIARLEAER